MAEMAVNRTFEVDASNWESNSGFGAYTVSTIARSTAQFHSGAASLAVTYPAVTGGRTWANHVGISGHIAGRRYKMSAWVYVPSGKDDVSAEVIFLANGARMSVKNAWTLVECEYVATQSSHHIGVRTVDPFTSSGVGMYIDDVSVQDMLTGGTWKSPLNMPAMTMQQLVNRGSFGAGAMPRLTMQNVVNRGAFTNALMPRMETDMLGTVAPPRKILIDGVLKNLVRVKWPS